MRFSQYYAAEDHRMAWLLSSVLNVSDRCADQEGTTRRKPDSRKPGNGSTTSFVISVVAAATNPAIDFGGESFPICESLPAQMANAFSFEVTRFSP
jgi:hypothetical protein